VGSQATHVLQQLAHALGSLARSVSHLHACHAYTGLRWRRALSCSPCTQPLTLRCRLAAHTSTAPLASGLSAPLAHALSAPLAHALSAPLAHALSAPLARCNRRFGWVRRPRRRIHQRRLQVELISFSRAPLYKLAEGGTLAAGAGNGRSMQHIHPTQPLLAHIMVRVAWWRVRVAPRAARAQHAKATDAASGAALAGTSRACVGHCVEMRLEVLRTHKAVRCEMRGGRASEGRACDAACVRGAVRARVRALAMSLPRPSIFGACARRRAVRRQSRAVRRRAAGKAALGRRPARAPRPRAFRAPKHRTLPPVSAEVRQAAAATWSRRRGRRQRQREAIQ
jgi:hypothetical protein